MKILCWRTRCCLAILFVASCFVFPAASFASGEGNGNCPEGLMPDCFGACGGDAVMMACGCNQGLNEHGCCNNEVPDCNGTCGGGAQELECGCDVPANPDGCCDGLQDIGCGCGVSPCPQECIYVAAWADWSGLGGSGNNGNDLRDRVNTYSYQPGGQVPGCFTNYFASRCQYHGPYTGTTVYYGACQGGAGYYASGGYGSAYSHLDLADFLGVPSNLRNPNFCANFSYTYGCGYKYTNWYMDQNCNYRAPDGNTKLCGFAGVSWSPISLIWDGRSSLEQGMTVVDFSLTADSSKGFSLWKASDAAPLLVFDPEHTGVVNSARQLFGNYALGGQTTRVADFSSEKLREPWSNGYDALGLLDINKDGKVSGSELNPVALWFDKNRDARVDEGELRRAADEGIVSLFYKDAAAVGDSNDLHLGVGFERVVDGKTITGSSVDWFTEVFESKQEAMLALSAVFQNKKQNVDADKQLAKSNYFEDSVPLETRSYVSWPRNEQDFKPHVAADHKKDISGYWVWILNEKDGPKHPGYFALEHQNDGTVLGYSIIESTLSQNSLNLKANVSILPAKGFVEQENDGKSFQFEVYDRRSGSSAISVAKLSQDGKTLRGVTSQTFSAEEGGKSASASVDYEWTAFKVMPGDGDKQKTVALLQK